MTNLIRKSDPFSSSAQIFEDIFKEATQTVEKPGGEKSKQEPSKGLQLLHRLKASNRSPSTKLKASQPEPPQKAAQFVAEDQTRPPEKPQPRNAAPPRREEPKPRPPEKPANKISPLKVVLLVVLLAVLAGAVVNHLGDFDVSALSPIAGLGEEGTGSAGREEAGSKGSSHE